MPIAIGELFALRPLLFHLTDAMNVDRIRRVRTLQSVNQLFAHANSGYRSSQRRTSPELLQINGESIVVRDQRPLVEANISFYLWDFARLLHELNDMVFFWPGTDAGPIRHGRRHFERYRGDGVCILRIRTAELLHANSNNQLLVCKFNSGSPRYSKGRPSPRGPSTFVIPEQATFLPSEVVEVTFRHEVVLPTRVEIASAPDGPWLPL